MAIPVISPLAAKAAPPGKVTNPAGNDQGAADFAAVLAQQRPTDPVGSNTSLATQALNSAAANSPIETTAIPPLPSVATNQLAGEIAIATTADAGALQAELSVAPTINHEQMGEIVSTAIQNAKALKAGQPAIPTVELERTGKIAIAETPNTGMLSTGLPSISVADQKQPAELTLATTQNTGAPQAEQPSTPAANQVPTWAKAISATQNTRELRAEQSAISTARQEQERENSIAAAQNAGALQTEQLAALSVDQNNLGKITSADALANPKNTAEDDKHGQANALEQIARNPGLGLGLTATASIAGQPAEVSGKTGKRLEKDLPASSGDAAQSPTVAPLTVPLTFPANSRVEDQAAAADPVLSATSAAKSLPAESLSQTANLAGESLAAGSGSQMTFSAALAAQHASAGQESAKAAPPSIDTPLQSSNWGRNFGEGVVWMAKNDQQTAQININPPQLGPIQITLHLNGDQASAVFASPHAEVRQAIQDAMPQLRDMLAASGVNLGQADVGSQGSTPGREFAAQQGNQNRAGDENAILSPDTQFADKSHSQPILRGRGLVDLFA